MPSRRHGRENRPTGSQQIELLSEDPAGNAHQLTRWTINMESHALSLQETVLNYFLAQRLKADAANVEKLHGLLDRFAEAFGSRD